MSEQDTEKSVEAVETASAKSAQPKAANAAKSAKSSASAPKSRSSSAKTSSGAASKPKSSAPKSTGGAGSKAKSSSAAKTTNASGAKNKSAASKSASSSTAASKSKTPVEKTDESKSGATKAARARTAKAKTAETENSISTETESKENKKSVEAATAEAPFTDGVKDSEIIAPVADSAISEEEQNAKTEESVEVSQGSESETVATEASNSTEIVAPAEGAESTEQIDESEYLNGKRPLLQVKNLKKYFLINNSFLKKNRKYLHAVEGVSFDLFAGKTIGIVGESGCGKTTMGRTILRLTDVTGGEVLFKGKDLAKLKGEPLRKLRPQFQMIFQDPYSSLSPRMPVGEIIGEAVKVHNIVPKAQYKDYIIDIMEKCGLQSHYFERYPHEFSGGQRQRICIAKVLALNPQLVICDEPVSALDVSIQAQIINLFKDLQNTHNLTYVFISHDLSVVEHISDDVGVMYLGNMVELAPKKALYAHPMHPYTEALLSAVPMPDPSVKMNRITLNGDIPSPANPPKGCKFHTRCTKCMDVCKEVEPKFKNYGDGHCVACHLYSQD